MEKARWILKEDHDAVMKKLEERIRALYRTTDHLSHEDERNSCAYILKEFFGAETEEGIFGGLFLKKDSLYLKGTT